MSKFIKLVEHEGYFAYALVEDFIRYQPISHEGLVGNLKSKVERSKKSVFIFLRASVFNLQVSYYTSVLITKLINYTDSKYCISKQYTNNIGKLTYESSHKYIIRKTIHIHL